MTPVVLSTAGHQKQRSRLTHRGGMNENENENKTERLGSGTTAQTWFLRWLPEPFNLQTDPLQAKKQENGNIPHWARKKEYRTRLQKSSTLPMPFMASRRFRINAATRSLKSCKTRRSLQTMWYYIFCSCFAGLLAICTCERGRGGRIAFAVDPSAHALGIPRTVFSQFE
jgi:hypothetical protein